MSRNYYINLKPALEDAGISRAELARISGVTLQSIHKLCNEPRAIRIDTLNKICAALYIEPSSLFGIRIKDD